MMADVDRSSVKNVKVAVRVRPAFLKRGSNSKNILTLTKNSVSIHSAVRNSVRRVSTFSFDQVFGPNSTQMHIFKEIGQPIVHKLFKGFNGTLLMYGKTGSGKSYTMMGYKSNVGLAQHCLEYIFNCINKLNENSNEANVHVSFLEIYNEKIKDLLARTTGEIQIQDIDQERVELKGLYRKPISNLQDILACFKRGKYMRSVGSIAENCESSRSHAIFTVYLCLRLLDRRGRQFTRHSKLNFVDLAGCERLSRSGTTGVRRDEAVKINLSLCTLAQVLSALADKRINHIPYRNSKLTRILKDSLGGNSSTSMIATLGSDRESYFETLNVLKYAAKAKSVRNKPKVNDIYEKEAHTNSSIQETYRCSVAVVDESHSSADGDAVDLAAPSFWRSIMLNNRALRHLLQSVCYEHGIDLRELFQLMDDSSLPKGIINENAKSRQQVINGPGNARPSSKIPSVRSHRLASNRSGYRRNL